MGMAITFLVMFAFLGVAMGDEYKVGDSAGWTNIGHVDYKTWSATKNFHVDDTILFEYNKQFHNVMRVTHKNFKACNATAPYATFTSGNDMFTIRKSGHFYFICGLPGHCQAGQKVDIRVPRTPQWTPSSSTPRAHAPVPIPVPAPAHMTPVSSPPPTPVPAHMTPAPHVTPISSPPLAHMTPISSPPPTPTHVTPISSPSPAPAHVTPISSPPLAPAPAPAHETPISSPPPAHMTPISSPPLAPVHVIPISSPPPAPAHMTPISSPPPAPAPIHVTPISSPPPAPTLVPSPAPASAPSSSPPPASYGPLPSPSPSPSPSSLPPPVPQNSGSSLHSSEGLLASKLWLSMVVVLAYFVIGITY